MRRSIKDLVDSALEVTITRDPYCQSEPTYMPLHPQIPSDPEQCARYYAHRGIQAFQFGEHLYVRLNQFRQTHIDLVRSYRYQESLSFHFISAAIAAGIGWLAFFVMFLIWWSER